MLSPTDSRPSRFRHFGLLLSLCLSLAFAFNSDASRAESCNLEAGSDNLKIRVDGKTRRFLVLVGDEAAKSEKAPLLFVWHGFGGSASQARRYVKPNRDWPEGIVVIPQGLDRRVAALGNRSAPGWQFAEGELDDRDLKFFDAMYEQLTTTYCVDKTQVFSTGMSNGGFFSNLLGCSRASKLKGIAPTASGGPFAFCQRDLAVHITHGTSDAIVNYNQGMTSLETWSRYNGCRAPDNLPRSGCVMLEGCSQPMQFCSHEGGHTWPNGTTDQIIAFIRQLAPK